MKNKPVRMGVAFRVDTISNVSLFKIHLNAAVRACERHLGRAMSPDTDNFRVVNIPLELLRIRVHDNRVKISAMTIRDVESNRCFIVDDDGQKHELAFGDTVDDEFEVAGTSIMGKLVPVPKEID